MQIDWTQVGEEAPRDTKEEWCADGSDQEFYKSPWADADEGDTFGTMEEKDGDDVVAFGQKDEDSVNYWVPKDQEAAKAYLVRYRVIELRATIESSQRELRDLG